MANSFLACYVTSSAHRRLLYFMHTPCIPHTTHKTLYEQKLLITPLPTPLYDKTVVDVVGWSRLSVGVCVCMCVNVPVGGCAIFFCRYIHSKLRCFDHQISSSLFSL